MTPDQRAAARRLCEAGAPWQLGDTRHPEAYAQAMLEKNTMAPVLLPAALAELDRLETEVGRLRNILPDIRREVQTLGCPGRDLAKILWLIDNALEPSTTLTSATDDLPYFSGKGP